MEEIIKFANWKLLVRERQKLGKHLDLAKKPKIIWNMKVTEIPIIAATLGNIPKNLEKELEGLDMHEMIEAPDHSTTENIKKSTGELRRLVITKTQVKAIGY